MSHSPFDGRVLRDVHYRRDDMAGSNFDGVNLAGMNQFFIRTESARYAEFFGKLIGACELPARNGLNTAVCAQPYPANQRTAYSGRA